MKRFQWLLLLLASAASAQQIPHCVQQPRPTLEYRDISGKMEYASMWACRAANYEEAWDVLIAGGVAPIRGVTVAELGAKANRKSRKTYLMIGLKVLQFVLPAIPVVGDVNEVGYQVLFVAGPKLVEEGINFVSGYPEDFQVTPSDGGYITVYSLAANQRIIPDFNAPRLGSNEPTDRERMQRDAVDSINRSLEKLPKPVAMLNDSRCFMNEAECEQQASMFAQREQEEALLAAR